MKNMLSFIGTFLLMVAVHGQQKVDSIFKGDELFLKRDLSAELHQVAQYIDHAEQLHHHELWAHYLAQPHPSVATVNKYMAQAAAEFKVPLQLLQVIAQVENNFTQLGPSIDQGWGMMHLVQNNYCNTLGEAAQLLGVSEQVLKDDAQQNIRGAASLLRKYFGNNKNTKATLEEWYPAVRKFSGLISDELRTIQADRYYTVLKDGNVNTTLWGETIVIPRKKNLNLHYIRSTFHPSNNTTEQEAGRSADYGAAVSSFTTCNYTSTRNHSIDTWVNHWIGTGTAAGAVSWFQNCSAGASAHFVTANTGTIYQVVPVASTAWHCGASGYPYNNGRSIGQEHEATIANPGLWNSTAMLQASAQMACYFCNEYNIPINQNITSPGICGHNSMPGTNTSCPGTIPWSIWFNYFNTGSCNAQSPVQPGNDYCGGATTLNVYGSTCGNTVAGDVNGATQSAAPTACDGFSSTNADDVWFTFTATSTAHTITVVPSTGMDVVVDLRNGCPGSSIDCEDAGGGEGSTEVLQATGLTIGNTYYVRVYDYTGANNPPTTTSLTICITTPCTQPVKPVISGNNVFCSGQSSQLSVSNPCSGCTYTWSNGSTGSAVIVTATGNYTVSATNNCASISSDPYSVTVNSTPQPVINNLSNAYCLASANVTLSAVPSGGNFSGNGITGNVFSPSTAGMGTHVISYTVSQNGCTGTASQSVTVSASPVVQISVSGATDFCNGENVTLTATQGTSYNWNNGAASQSITVSQSGSFNVTVTNPGGCNANVGATSPVVVTVHPNPVASAGADQTLLQVQNNSVTIGGAPTAFAGTSPYSYLWSPSSGLDSNEVANPVVSNLSSSTTYTVTVTDANGCTVTDNVIVSVTSLCTYTTQPAQIYLPASATTDSFFVSVSDTNCCAWNISTCNWLNIVSPNLPATGSSWVKFSVTANNDTVQRYCPLPLTGGQTITVVQSASIPDPCNPPITPPQVHLNFCDLAAQLIPNVSYQWYNSGIIISGANTRFHSATETGYYYVEVADSNFCSNQSQDVYVAYPDCSGTGMQVVSNEDVLRVYPNPVSDGVINVSVSDIPPGSELKIYDAMGRLMKLLILNNTPAEISVLDFSAGVYVVSLKTYSGMSATTRFLKLQ
jgi:N-acetyl-anhydromuramyl-L-alanine amidase AmpD